MRQIDLTTWPRRAHFLYYRAQPSPFFELTARVDVTNLYEVARARGDSLFAACLWSLSWAADQVDALRLRARPDGTVIAHDHIHPKWTIMAPDATFRFIRGTLTTDPAQLAAHAQRAAQSAATLELRPEDDSDDVLYMSCLPWMDFTGLHQTLPDGPSGDCIPRIVWGKIVPRARGGHDMAVAIAAHHGLVDGLHIARFFDAIPQALRAWHDATTPPTPQENPK